MRKLTTGDAIYVYGSAGKTDYTVRLSVRMDEKLDEAMLKAALEKTSRRYPYLCVRLMKNEAEYYFEDNDRPVCLFNTSDRISLGTEETNYHIWAVCFKDDYLHLDFYHGICDGTGIYFVLSTFLYYYVCEKYGPVSPEGIRTLEDPVKDGETSDPMDFLPEIDLSSLPPTLGMMEPPFSLNNNGGMTWTDETTVYDVIIPEKELLKYTSANDASPGTFITLIFARVIDKLYPEREKEILGNYVINARPMLDGNDSHHNCVNAIRLPFSDKIKKMPLDRQCTAYRGATFLQSDAEAVRNLMTFSSSRMKLTMKLPTTKEKQDAFSMMLDAGKNFFTYSVSYVGQWKHKEIGAHIREFWTHVPGQNGLLAEIAAVNSNIFLSIAQDYKEDTLYKAFLQELDEIGIPYTEKRCMINDVAKYDEP